MVSKPNPQDVKDEGLPTCFFATDLHGRTDRYDKLIASIVRDRPAAVFLGGDLLPRSSFSAIQSGQGNFVHDYLVPTFKKTRDALALIIRESEDKKSLLCYKHVDKTMFAVTKEASECLTIAQHSVCCSQEFFASL